MESSTLTYHADDGAAIHVYRWLPDTLDGAKGIVHIAHGLAEHAARYERFARGLTAAGYLVYANDHRGHGKTAKSEADLGFFAEREGFTRCVKDLAEMVAHWKTEHPSLPVVLMGHSMGSFLAQQYMYQFGDTVAGVVLSGSDGKPVPAMRILQLVAFIERLGRGPRGRSPLLDKMAFKDLNKRFEPARTEFDWLSRDGQEVDKYVADPLCGFMSTTQLWLDLARGAFRIAERANQARVPRDLPVYIFSGDADPLHRNLKGLNQLISAYHAVGLQNVSHRFYPQGRHEMLNEINRDEVAVDVIDFLNNVCVSASRVRMATG